MDACAAAAFTLTQTDLQRIKLGPRAVDLSRRLWHHTYCLTHTCEWVSIQKAHKPIRSVCRPKTLCEL